MSFSTRRSLVWATNDCERGIEGADATTDVRPEWFVNLTVQLTKS
jgi:hypothetical protein